MKKEQVENLNEPIWKCKLRIALKIITVGGTISKSSF